MLFTLAPQLWELKGHLPFLWSSVWMVAAEVANIKLDKAILEIWLARMYHCKLNFLSLELQSLSLGLRLATGNSGLGRRRVARTKENSEAVVVGKEVEVARLRP